MSDQNSPRTLHYTKLLTRVFNRTHDKRAALAQTRPILEDMSGDSLLLTEIIRKHLLMPGALSKKHYPVVSMDLAKTPYCGLVANCWIPLPDRQTDLSTKSIHHHGDMLLNTVTIFGPGYEHWMFTPPQPVDLGREVFAMSLLDRAPHPLHHVTFVDSNVAHVPFYPASLTITLALWSSRDTVTWRDHVKRMEVFRGKEPTLRKLAIKAGLKKALDLKVIEYFDFYPADQGFKGIRDREEFPHGPNCDYLYSLFHIIQQTGNEAVIPAIESQLHSSIPARQTVVELLEKLKSGVLIEGRLSDKHYGVPRANFTSVEIERSLTTLAVQTRRSASA
jgi:hypothetical protein